MNDGQDIVQIWMEPTGWQMQIMGKGNPHGPGHYDEIVVKPGDTDNVTFQIVKTPHASFATNVPFCAQANVPKPTVCDPVFTPGAGGGQQLKVFDANTDKQDYNYVLSFNNYPPLDPIFNNGGNGRPTTSTSTTLLAAALILALIVGVFYASRRFKPVTNPPNIGDDAGSELSGPPSSGDAGPDLNGTDEPR